MNLIPFNPIPYQDWKPSRPERIEAFAEILEKRGVSVAVRASRGRDIDAACGQLRGHTLVQIEADQKMPRPTLPQRTSRMAGNGS